MNQEINAPDEEPTCIIPRTQQESSENVNMVPPASALLPDARISDIGSHGLRHMLSRRNQVG